MSNTLNNDDAQSYSYSYTYSNLWKVKQEQWSWNNRVLRADVYLCFLIDSVVTEFFHLLVKWILFLLAFRNHTGPQIMSFLLVWLSSMIMGNGANFLRNDVLKANVFGISKQSNNGKKYMCVYIFICDRFWQGTMCLLIFVWWYSPLYSCWCDIQTHLKCQSL